MSSPERIAVGWLKFGVSAVLGALGVFRRFPGLAWRGSVRHPLIPWRRINHSQGEMTSATDKHGRVSRNSRTRRVSVDLPGPLRWRSRGRS